MEMVVIGNAGARALVFPTSKGRFFEWEDRGMFGQDGMGYAIDVVFLRRDGLVLKVAGGVQPTAGSRRRKTVPLLSPRYAQRRRFHMGVLLIIQDLS